MSFFALIQVESMKLRLAAGEREANFSTGAWLVEVEGGRKCRLRVDVLLSGSASVKVDAEEEVVVVVTRE